jgi:mRNA interferase MazF
LAETLAPGDIVLVTLPSNQPRGREQEGRRPALVVGIPKGQVRYPMLFVAPLTTQKGEWVQRNSTLYPTLANGTGGLSQDSVVLLDQIRAID